MISKPLALAIAAALAMLVAQLFLIGRVELTFDEAYYTLWSRSLAWGYFDHPPMVAAWIRASTMLFGPSEFGVRALNTIVVAMLPGGIAFVAWRLFESGAIAALSALLWLSMPLVAGAPIVTPDAPLVVFWTLGLAALVEFWRGRASAWIGVGLALGLAGLSKFTAAFLGAGIVLALAWTPSLRRAFASPRPYLAALIAAAVVSPFLIWNAEHGWVTFAKQFGRVPARGFAPGYLGEFLLSQFGLADPLTLTAAAVGIGAAARRWRSAPTPYDEARRLLIATIAPAMLYFTIHALHDRVQGNWLAPLYPALAILAADAATRGPEFARAAGRWAPPLGFAAIALAYAHVATGWPALGAADPLARIGGWRELAGEVFTRAREERAAFILARGYAATSLLTYYGQAEPPVFQADERERWAFRPPLDQAVFAAPGIAFGEANRGFATELSTRFGHVEEVARLSRDSEGARVGEFELYRVSQPLSSAPSKGETAAKPRGPF